MIFTIKLELRYVSTLFRSHHYVCIKHILFVNKLKLGVDVIRQLEVSLRAV